MRRCLNILVSCHKRGLFAFENNNKNIFSPLLYRSYCRWSIYVHVFFSFFLSAPRLTSPSILPLSSQPISFVIVFPSHVSSWTVPSLLVFLPSEKCRWAGLLGWNTAGWVMRLLATLLATSEDGVEERRDRPLPLESPYVIRIFVVERRRGHQNRSPELFHHISIKKKSWSGYFGPEGLNEAQFTHMCRRWFLSSKGRQWIKRERETDREREGERQRQRERKEIGRQTDRERGGRQTYRQRKREREEENSKWDLSTSLTKLWRNWSFRDPQGWGYENRFDTNLNPFWDFIWFKKKKGRKS